MEKLLSFLPWLLLIYFTGCVDADAPQKLRVASSKQGLSVPPVKPEKEHGAVARIQSWKGKEQQEPRQRLLSSHRAWVQQKWQASRAQHEQLRLRMLQQAQHVRSQLSKVQQQRATQAQGSRP